jgi:hypothetical protein
MRHTNSRLILMAGGRLFPGVHQRATFDVSDTGAGIDISIRSAAGDMDVALRGKAAGELPEGSTFPLIGRRIRVFPRRFCWLLAWSRQGSARGVDSRISQMARGSVGSLRGALLVAL